MTTAATTNTEQALLKAAAAANADRLSASAPPAVAFGSTGSWDSYEVWRRFFKEARDRRDEPTAN